MKKISDKVYSRINNRIYDHEGERWWEPDFSLNLIRAVINPVRVSYATRAIEGGLHKPCAEINLLEVGCGGGLLSEEFAALGYNVTGIDPAARSVSTAIRHARDNDLKINYLTGTGEKLPFEQGSFDVVLCCDVLEHVADLPGVFSEISRVLKSGGIFVYDTFNRTYFSRISAIKILQEWKRWAIMPPGLHVWEMFIKPSEIKALLSENNMKWAGHTGINPGIPYLAMLKALRKRASGKLTYEEFGRKVSMVESRSTSIMYMGHAVKQEKIQTD